MASLKSNNKPGAPLSDKCFGCLFWSWFEEYHSEGCEIKGCYNHSKFVEYSFERWQEYINKHSKN